MSADLLHSEKRKTIVRHAYQAVVSTGGAVASNLYDGRQLALVPERARDIALGVANHMAHADIAPGDTVLDIGCGGGIDTVLAAAAVGPTGKVYALDFLPEMLQRTALAAAAAGVDDVVETVEGEMEAIPLPDGSVDFVISNGVINLSPRKSRVFAECARVLRPGGRFCVSDVTIVEEQLPPEVLVHPTAWTGCVAGALAEHDFVAKMERMGFVDIQVVSREDRSIDDFALYPLFTDELIALMRTLIPAEQQHAVATAVVIKARLGENQPGDDAHPGDYWCAPRDSNPEPAG